MFELCERTKMVQEVREDPHIQMAKEIAVTKTCIDGAEETWHGRC